MTSSKSTQIVPWFDRKRNERAAKYKVQLFPIHLKGSWAQQDACGGHQWNAAINKWVI
tara:strand:+ start:290 stop:463 length:174 start_codon:yes stop_codon:yes gene_type:complete